ncbi:MAG: DNA helicase RecQ [Gammaproteobacteria bacterium]|nr:DNA helicase RecQ [Gammaproteobacteria bacterium]
MHESTSKPGAPAELSALSILRDVYGYGEFRRDQADIIDHVCAGNDALVLMPTGGGKSLCYQIPSLLRPGLGVVVSPLIALMRDQVRALERLGVRAAFLNSSLSRVEQDAVVARAERGDLDLLYIAPERLMQADTLGMLRGCGVCLIAIDEAHCVSSWGHDFRQDYLELHRLGAAFPGVPRMALTATADARTRADIVARLDLAEPAEFIGGFDRPNICYAVQPKTDAKTQLLRFLADHEGESGIVYCLSRKSVESTAEWLHGRGFDALPYHAGLDAQTRMHHQERFLRDDAVVMVATIAFGMGIDKPDVRFVAHLDLPKSTEAYYQETGRAGRDGEPADAWMVYGLQDVVRLSRMVEQSDAGVEHKRVERSKLDRLLGWCEVTSCRRRHLLEYFGETLPEDCGNCDICLRPPVTWDGTETAQKALSCVYRTGQRFGAGHVIDVLRGQSRDKVLRFGHQRLSTFGVGADLTDAQWRSVIRQLVVGRYLRVDHDGFGALQLTEASRALLRGEETLLLREDPAQTKTARVRRGKRPKATVEIEDEALLDALRALRKQIADDAGVPPYVVFHDATLLGLIERRPGSLGDMLEVSGIGQSKLQKYGQRFLDVLDGFDRAQVIKDAR